MQMLDLFLMELSFQFHLNNNLTVLIQHGNYITAYKNLANVYVEKGQKINALQTIGITFDNDESKLLYSLVFLKTQSFRSLFMDSKII